jgi:hypothetical protein
MLLFTWKQFFGLLKPACSCNLPVYIKQIGSKRIRIDKEIRKEVHFMKSTRHSKLTEFVGLIIEPERIFVVEGNLKSILTIYGINQLFFFLEYCAKGSLANVLANPDFDLPWIFRFSLINDIISGKYIVHGERERERKREKKSERGFLIGFFF